MSADRRALTERLAAHYRDGGWKAVEDADGILHADGPGGVTWIGMAIVPEDLDQDGMGERLRELADRRMAAGQLCPLELLPAPACADDVRALLSDIGLADRGHVAVYSLPAAA